MTRVGMHEAKSRLSELVRLVEAGEEVVIARNGTPVARLVPPASTDRFEAVRGAWRGEVELADDFDELPEELRRDLGTLG